MPQINRVRLVNVSYNNNTQSYDDVLFNYGSKSVTYGLLNGGGKSLKMQMVFQSMLPNCSLGERSLADIFAGCTIDKTSHSLVEWSLDEGNEYKYLLTGFCAKKIKSSFECDEEQKSSKGEIQYFNYTYFYNDPNEYDIENLKLREIQNNTTKVMSYSKLRDEIFRLKDKKLPIALFDGVREYKNFLMTYNIIEAEWDLIRRINYDEGVVKEYFRKSYPTSRKVVEELLLKIVTDIQKLQIDDKVNKSLSTTLMNMGKTFQELMKAQENKKEHIEIISYCEKFLNVCSQLKEEFVKLEGVEKNAVLMLNKLELMIREFKESKVDVEKRGNEELFSINDLKYERDCLEIETQKYKIESLKETLAKLQNELQNLKNDLSEKEKKYNMGRAINKYLEFKENEVQIDIAYSNLNNLDKSTDEKDREFKVLGYNYKVALQEIIDGLQNEKHEVTKNIKNINQDIDLNQTKINTIHNEIGNLQGLLKSEKGRKQQLDSQISDYSGLFQKSGNLNFIISSKESLGMLVESIQNTEENILNTSQDIAILKDKVQVDKFKIVELNSDTTSIYKDIRGLETFFEAYNTKLSSINQYMKQRDFSGSYDEYIVKLNSEISNIDESVIEKGMKCNTAEKVLKNISQSGTFIPNNNLIILKEQLRKRFDNVFLGSEILENYSEEKRQRLVNANVFLPYSIILTSKDFTKLQSDNTIIDKNYFDFPVPIINHDSIEEEQGNIPGILFIDDNKEFFLSKEKLEIFKGLLLSDINSLKNEIKSLKFNKEQLEQEKREISIFLLDYPEEKIQENKNILDSLNRKARESQEAIECIQNEIKDLELNIASLNEKLTAYEETLKILKTEHSNLIAYIDLTDESDEKKGIISDLNSKIKNSEEVLNSLEESKKKLNEALRVEREKDTKITNLLGKRYDEAKGLTNFEPAKISELTYDVIRTDFLALKRDLEGKQQEEKSLEEKIDMLKNSQRTLKDFMSDLGFGDNFFKDKENRGEILEEFSVYEMQELQVSIDILKGNEEPLVQRVRKIESNIDKQDGKIELLMKNILDTYSREYIKMPGITSAEDVFEASKINSSNIVAHEINIAQIKEELKEIESNLSKTEKEAQRIKDFISTSEILFQSDEIIENPVSFEKIKSLYKALNEKIKSLTENFEKEKKTAFNETKLFNISEFSKQVEEMPIPKSVLDTEFLIEKFELYIDTNNSAIETIDEDIRYNLQYQESFIDDCMYKSQSLLDTLKTFDSNSRIKVNGKNINILKTVFYEYSDEEKKTRIKEHIENIIKEISRTNITDVKYANEQLSPKVLLSLIVDMDRAKVSIYKFEAIDKNSRYLEWKDAVGSSGQSNSMYIMFVISLISYIRSLNLKNSSVHSTKTLFLDNPFGKTNATYLWEPVFALLKENDFQIIIPCHTAVAKLVPYIDINIILRQDYVSATKTTVVLEDIHTQKDPNMIKFESLGNIQQSLFENHNVD